MTEAEFRNLYRQYRDPLFRFGYRLTGSAETAEDLVHDSFLGLFRGGFDPKRGAIRTYLYTAVRNLAGKRFRDFEREDLTGEFEDLATEAGGQLDCLLARQTAEEVRAAVSSLPLRQREVLLLFEYEDLPLSEIAAIVDADLAAVKSRLHRARLRLRQVLAPVAKGTIR